MLLPIADAIVVDSWRILMPESSAHMVFRARASSTVEASIIANIMGPPNV